MEKINILFFSLGKHDVAGNKRLNNLAKYFGQNQYINTRIIKPAWDYANVHKLRGARYSLIKSACLLLNVFLFPFIIFKWKRANSKNLLYFYEAEHLLFHRLVLARLLGYKLIVDLVENPDSTAYATSILKKIRIQYFLLIYKTIPFFFSGVVVVSGYLKEKIIEDFKNKVPVFLLPVSYDPDDFLGVWPTIPHSVFYGGSYGSNYDFLSLFKALGQVQHLCPHMKLYLSGKIPADIAELLKNEASLEKNVVLLGFLSEDDYFRTIKSMEVLCLPRNNTIQANAGFPFKLAEYLAAGNPVITSKVSDVAGYLSPKEAFIYEPDSFEELKNKIFEALSDKFKAKQVGENGRIAAEKFFNAKNQANDFFIFLKTALK